MTVYVINNMRIRDRDAYKVYTQAFMAAITQIGGQVLAVQNKPEPIEGEWPHDRTVLLSFPSREVVEQWTTSTPYQALAELRRAATHSNVLVLDALPSTP